MTSPFEKLVNDFAVFTIKNKLPVSKNILLKNNEELVVPGYATVDVDSSLLLGVPSSNIFKAVKPSVSDFVKYGVLVSKNPKKETKPQEEAKVDKEPSNKESSESTSVPSYSYNYKNKKK